MPRLLRWCTTHGEPAWEYADGSTSCMYDLVVGYSNYHDLTDLPAATERDAALAENARFRDELAEAEPPLTDEEITSGIVVVLAENARLRALVLAAEPTVMHPHMSGDHQVSYRGSGKNLTPEQWTLLAAVLADSDGGE